MRLFLMFLPLFLSASIFSPKDAFLFVINTRYATQGPIVTRAEVNSLKHLLKQKEVNVKDAINVSDKGFLKMELTRFIKYAPKNGTAYIYYKGKHYSDGKELYLVPINVREEPSNMLPFSEFLALIREEKETRFVFVFDSVRIIDAEVMDWKNYSLPSNITLMFAHNYDKYIITPHDDTFLRIFREASQESSLEEATRKIETTLRETKAKFEPLFIFSSKKEPSHVESKEKQEKKLLAEKEKQKELEKKALIEKEKKEAILLKEKQKEVAVEYYDVTLETANVQSKVILKKIPKGTYEAVFSLPGHVQKKVTLQVDDQLKKRIILSSDINDESYKKSDEEIFWDYVRVRNDMILYKMYLSRYPKGKFASIAKSVINESTGGVNEAWERVKYSQKREEIETFLREFSNSRYVSIAKAKLSGIVWEEIKEDTYEDVFDSYMARFPKSIYYAKAKELKEKYRGKKLLDAKVNQGNYILPEMVKITGGSFLMGSYKGYGDEYPVHKVTIGYDFYMMKYEVTVEEFQKFVKDSHYMTDAESEKGCYVLSDGVWDIKRNANWQNPYFPQKKEEPVVCISYNDAKAYAKWLSEKSGLNFRLPSESEWEYVAKAGTNSKWFFGDTENMICDYANVADNTLKQKEISTMVAPCNDRAIKTARVGKYRPNPFGLYDIYGNVWEWCEDSYSESYREAPTDGSAVDFYSSYKVLRGGSWNDVPVNVASSIRYGKISTKADSDNGFRLVLIK